MKEKEKALRGIVMLLTIGRICNCKTGEVCDVFGNPLSKKQIATGLDMKEKDFVELLEVLENTDLIEVLTSKHRDIIIINEWISNLLQWYLTRDKSIGEGLNIPDKYSNTTKYAIGLFLKIMCYCYFKNRIITNSEGKPLSMAELGRQFKIDRADISASFRLLEKKGLLKLEQVENSNLKNIVVAKMLVDELKHYGRRILPKNSKPKECQKNEI